MATATRAIAKMKTGLEIKRRGSVLLLGRLGVDQALGNEFGGAGPVGIATSDRGWPGAEAFEAVCFRVES